MHENARFWNFVSTALAAALRACPKMSENVRIENFVSTGAGRAAGGDPTARQKQNQRWERQKRRLGDQCAKRRRCQQWLVEVARQRVEVERVGGAVIVEIALGPD